MTPTDLTGGNRAPKRRLSAKFSEFRKVMKLDEQPEFAAMALQGAYIAGAQACFQILQSASKESAEDALIIWGETQHEILNAMPKREALIEALPEKKIILPS